MRVQDEVTVTIGRDAACDLSLPADADSVSRRHAEAVWSDELHCIVVRDLGSTNGIFPGEEAFTAADGSIRLTPGQHVILGEQVLDFDAIKRALDGKARRLEGEQIRASLAAKRAGRRRWSFGALTTLLLVGLLGAGTWFMLESTRTAEEAAATAREAAGVAEQARRAREAADEWIAERENALAIEPDARMIGPFIDHENGTVTDTRTGLMWRQCSLGRTWQDGRCVGETGRYAWDQAQPAVDLVNQEGGLSGYGDWRLPTLVELLTLVREGQGLIHPEAFPGVMAGHHWSVTPWNERERRYWNVHLHEGVGYWDETGVRRFVLPVRAVTAPAP